MLGINAMKLYEDFHLRFSQSTVLTSQPCLTSILPQNAYDISSKLVPGIIECVPDNLKWLESAKAFSSNKKRTIRGINKSSGIFILL